MDTVMRKCYSCGRLKELDAFHKNRREKLGREYVCKECKKNYDVVRNLQYKDLARTKKTTQRQQRLRDIRQLKKGIRCQVCGEAEPCCLDFHHRRDKKISVSRAIWSSGWKMANEEIEKCIVLCSNCHRKLHAGVISLEESKTA